MDLHSTRHYRITQIMKITYTNRTKSPAVLYTLAKVLKDNFTCKQLFLKAWTVELLGKH